MATIRLFASIKEKIGAAELHIRISDRQLLRNVLAQAASDNGVEEAWLVSHRLLYAVNQQMAGLDHMVGDGDEIAVLPPMSGGV